MNVENGPGLFRELTKGGNCLRIDGESGSLIYNLGPLCFIHEGRLSKTKMSGKQNYRQLRKITKRMHPYV